MIRRLYWIAVLIMLLSLPALACGVFGGDEAEATAVPEAAPADVEESPADSEPEPTAVPAVEEPAAEEPVEETAEEPAAEEAPPLPDSALSLNTMDELPYDSYRVSMVLEVTGTDANAEEVTQGMQMDMAFVKEPQAMEMLMSFYGLDDEMSSGDIAMAQVEGVSYMVVPEMGCITTSGEDLLADNPFTSMVDPDTFMEDLGNTKYEGEETVNGIRTRHYSFDKFGLTGTSVDEVESAEGHIYIAKEGDFLVRMVVDASGQIDLFDEGLTDGVMHVELNLTDVDEPIEVTIPETCAAQGGAGGSGSEFPMVDDATNVTSFAGVLSYETALSTEDVLAFYDDALAEEGWEKDEDGSFIGGGSAFVNYTLDGVTLNLTVSANEDTGGNYVILLSDAGE